MKKLYFTALILCAALQAHAAWDGTAEAWTAGDGSAESPFLIENERHLAHLQATVNEGESYAGKYFRLTADLDMGASDDMLFHPIGIFDDYFVDSQYYKESMAFEGVFDGDYHTIDNMRVVYADPDELGGVGLFGVGRNTTEIKNLILGANVEIDAPDSPSVGAVIGYSDGCHIVNCSMAGTIDGGSAEVGGIVGTAQGGTLIEGCVSTGTINAHSSCGGIIGYAPNSEIKNCFSSAEVNCPLAYMVGGIVGWLYKSTLSNSVAVGKVTAEAGSSWLGGKSPVCSELEESTIINCYYVEALTGCKPLSAQPGVTALTEDELKSPATLEALNVDEVWCAGSNGFPALEWTVSGHSAISGIAAAKTAVSVVGGSITVDAAGRPVAVYDLSGRMVYSASGLSQATFAPASRGIYLVRVGSSAPVKVAL